MQQRGTVDSGDSLPLQDTFHTHIVILSIVNLKILIYLLKNATVEFWHNISTITWTTNEKNRLYVHKYSCKKKNKCNLIKFVSWAVKVYAKLHSGKMRNMFLDLLNPAPSLVTVYFRKITSSLKELCHLVLPKGKSDSTLQNN